VELHFLTFRFDDVFFVLPVVENRRFNMQTNADKSKWQSQLYLHDISGLQTICRQGAKSLNMWDLQRFLRHFSQGAWHSVFAQFWLESLES